MCIAFFFAIGKNHQNGAPGKVNHIVFIQSPLFFYFFRFFCEGKYK
jgi:hypothetical protein